MFKDRWDKELGGCNTLPYFHYRDRVIMMDDKDQTIRILPTETYFAMVRRMLSESGSAYVRITGTSMLPLLHHLRDGVIIEPLYRQGSKTDIQMHPKPPDAVDPKIINIFSIYSDGTPPSDNTASTLQAKPDGTPLSDNKAPIFHAKSDGTSLSDISVSTQQLNNTPNTANEIDPYTGSVAGSCRQNKNGSMKSPLKLRKGDIVLFDRRNGRYALHRVIRINKDGFYMAGDNQWHIETNLPYDQIIGVVTSIERNGKIISRDNLLLRAYSYCVVILTVPRILVYKLMKRFFHFARHSGI